MTNNTQSSWKYSTLGEVANWASGGTPTSSNNDYYGGELPWAIIGDLNDGNVTQTSKHITALGLENSSAKIVKPGSLLVAMYGSIGKLGIADVELATNQAIAFTTQIFGGIPVKYIYYYLMFKRPKLLLLGKGGAQLNISQSILKNFEIPIPPLQAQQRIVKKLDELFQKSENIKQRLDTISQKINLYERSKIAELLHGGNGPQQDLQEAQNQQASKQNVSLPLQALTTLPLGWKWILLKDIAKIQGGVTKGRNLKESPTIEVPYLRVANVQDGFLNLDEIKTIHIKSSEKDRYMLRNGDLLLTEGGDRDKLGRGTIWREEIKNCSYQNHIFRARIDLELASAEYVSMMTKTAFSRKYFYENANQTVNLASINITVLGNLPIPLAPRSQQDLLVINYDRTKKLNVSLQNKLDLIHQRMRMLTANTLERIFDGKQIELDKHDEPVEKLFLRIEKEKSYLLKNSFQEKRPKPSTLKTQPITTLQEMVSCLNKLGGEAPANT